MLDYLLLLVMFIRAMIGSHAKVAAENLLLRQQLAVLTRPTRKRPRLQPLDRAFWALTRHLRSDWRQHALFVRPETVIRWHRQGWRLFWRWKSRSRFGRPRLSPDVRELIATMARDNPRWGSERLRGELRTHWPILLPLPGRGRLDPLTGADAIPTASAGSAPHGGRRGVCP
jgi:hypothetical protein